MKQSDLHNKQANKNLQELKTFVWGYRNYYGTVLLTQRLQVKT